eukprot:9412991-Pyramimonas_sp.AAC.1
MGATFLGGRRSSSATASTSLGPAGPHTIHFSEIFPSPPLPYPSPLPYPYPSPPLPPFLIIIILFPIPLLLFLLLSSSISRMSRTSSLCKDSSKKIAVPHLERIVERLGTVDIRKEDLDDARMAALGTGRARCALHGGAPRALC